MKKFTVFILFVLVVGLAACGGGGASDSGGGASATNGEDIFNQKLVGTQPGCVTCHSLEPGVTMVGPSLANIGNEAANRVSGQSAEEYLRNSILHPDEHLVEGFAAGTMPAQIANELSEEQVNDLVAYLTTLKQ